MIMDYKVLGVSLISARQVLVKSKAAFKLTGLRPDLHKSAVCKKISLELVLNRC